MTGKVAGAARGSPLRQRMIEQMRIANLAESTQSAYLFEVERLILATPDLRHRAAFIAAYGAGLRVSETATVAVDEFIRRFLLHVLPERLHRIRHFGILANGCRATQFALDRSHHPAAEGPMGSPQTRRQWPPRNSWERRVRANQHCQSLARNPATTTLSTKATIDLGGRAFVQRD